MGCSEGDAAWRDKIIDRQKGRGTRIYRRQFPCKGAQNEEKEIVTPEATSPFASGRCQIKCEFWVRVGARLFFALLRRRRWRRRSHLHGSGRRQR